MSSFQPKVTRCTMKLKSETHTPEKKEANENVFWVGPDVGFSRQGLQSSYYI